MNRKKLKLSLEVKDTERYLDERITTLEKKVADKGAQLNLNGVFKVKEKKEIKKSETELKTLRTQLKLEKDQLLIEKIQLGMLLREKEHLYNKAVNFDKRLISVQEKFDSFSNEVMKSSVAARNINSLPDEILLKIFEYLSQNKFGRIAQVCKRWNVLTKSPVLWKIVDVELYESTSEAVKMFVQTLPSCVSSIKLNFMDMEYWEGDYWQHQKLDFEELCVMIQEKCPHLQLLNMWNALFSNNLQSITDLCTRFLPNVRRLVFYHCGFMEWSARMSNNGVSKIEALDIVKCYFELFDFPRLSKIPCLRELNLHGTVVNELLFENDIPFLNQLKVLNLGFTGIEYLRTFKTILSHAVNLEELYLCDINLYINDLNLNNLALPHLKTICLRSRWDVDCEDIISLIQSCQSLENVFVDDDVAESYAKDPFVVNNRCKLEIVKANNNRDCHSKNRLYPQSLENVDDDVAESYAKDPFVVNNRCKLEIVKANNIRDCHPKNRLCKCFIPG